MRTVSLLVASLGLAACDYSTKPTKANIDTVNRNPQIGQDARPKSTTGGDHPATAPVSK
jgi:hypothetical protein